MHEQENFDSLRRLLALKRHEQPPPRYFQNFSGHVIARIRAGERVDRSGFWESLSWEAPWLQRLWGSFESKPILAGALGMAVCGLLVSGIALSEKAVTPNVTTLTGTGSQMPVDIALQSTPNPQGLTTLGVAPDQSSTALFDGMKLPSATLVKWTGSSGN